MKLRNLGAEALLAQSSFPRITPDEEFLLRDFVRDFGRMYHMFSVDVPVGAASITDWSIGSALEHMWEAITRRRVDLVAFHAGGVAIVEAKVHATMRAATQVLRYAADYERDHPNVPSVVPVIVCRSSVPGLAARVLGAGGRLIEIPAIVAFSGDAFPRASEELPHD